MVSAAACSSAGLMLNPRLATNAEAPSTVPPVAPAGAFIEKYSAGSRMQAAISALMATKDSISMPP